MRAAVRSALALVCGLSAALSLPAQQHPSHERGFDPEKVYQLGDLDSVNLLNGNVAITIPLGMSLPVSGALSYGLTLVYNSKVWDFQQVYHQGLPRSQALPDRLSNAGMGWSVSLGRLLAPTDPENDHETSRWAYLGPDGGEHLFYARLDVSDPAGSTPCVVEACYSRDGSYLRLRSVNTITRELDFPDGITHVFQTRVFANETRWRLTAIRDRFGGTTPDVTVTYDAGGAFWGMVHQVQHANGATDTQANDPHALRRPASITTTFAGSPRWSTGAYAYDGAGNVTRMGTATWFLYDKVSRLVTGNLDLGPTGNGGTGIQRQQTYSHDPFGNLTAINGANGRNTPTNSETNRLNGAVSYDAAGNLIAWNGATYEYDPFHQMSRMLSGSEEWRYGYTADGERVWMFKVGANLSRWTLRGLNGEVLREYINEGGQWRTDRDYVYRDGLLLAAEGAQGRRHFHLDHLGTPRLITNRVGWGDWYHVYYPFGEEATAFDQDTDRMKFTGHERDLASPAGAGDDLDSMHARHCSPLTGRFLSVDPALESAHRGMPQTWNRYSYVGGNPLNNIDPSGEALFWVGPANAQRQVEQVANDNLHGVDLVLDGNGMASLVPNGETGPATPEQQAIQATLASAISRPEIVRLNLTSGSQSVIFGQYISGNLDINDIAAAGKGDGVNDGALLAHEVREQEVKQVGGLPNDRAGHAQAHIPAVAAQEAVSGFRKISSVRNLNSQNTGTIVGVHARGARRVTVTFQFVNGNLVRVTRR